MVKLRAIQQRVQKAARLLDAVMPGWAQNDAEEALVWRAWQNQIRRRRDERASNIQHTVDTVGSTMHDGVGGRTDTAGVLQQQQQTQTTS